ncbi:MAG: GNAT family N-acetyltransferase [Nanoarchaeota archaeon]
MELEKKDLAALQHFIEKNYHKKYILCNENFFCYFFTRNSPSFNVRILKIKEQIVGMLGRIPARYNYFGKDVTGAYLVNLMIDEEYRKLGLGPRLVLETEKEYDLLLNTGYGEQGKELYEKLKWTEMPPLHRAVCIMSNKCSVFSKKEIPLSTVKIAPRKGSHDFQQLTRFDRAIDSFWKKMRGKYPISINRDADYLNWRYADHPLLKYHLFVGKKHDHIVSFIILRIEEPPGFRIARIVDFVSADDAEEQTLLMTHDWAKKEKIDLIDCFSTGKFHEHALRNAGFANADKEPYTDIPLLFNPIDRVRKTIPFCFKPINQELFDKRILDSDNWYVTKGDGDQDRPN